MESIPDSIVYIDGQQKGKTPLEVELTDKDVLVKLIPESFSQEINPYEAKVRLTPGVKTIVRHVFANIPENSQSEIISFDSIPSSTSSIAVVTIPDGVKIKIDNKETGVTPVRLDNLLQGRHKIEVSAWGYRTRSFDVQSTNGFLLTAFIDLAQDENQKEQMKTEAVLSEEIEMKSQIPEFKTVTILDTPTGFLRIRKSPNVSSEEISIAKPGEKYKLISFNAESGWFEIEVASTSGMIGWISSEYASQSGEIRN